MYVRGYLQGSENGRVVTIGYHITETPFQTKYRRFMIISRRITLLYISGSQYNKQ